MTLFGMSRITISPLARRLIVLTVVFSSLVTLVLTSFQLYRDYRRDVGSINANLAQIRDVHLDSISETLWATGRTRLQIQLEGMLKVRDMHYLAVQEGNTIWAEAGSLTSQNVIRADLPILHEHRGGKIQIGLLTAVASLDGVYDRILDEAFIILASNAVKTFLVAGFMLVLFRGLITRHLSHIASYVRGLDVAADPPELRLERPDRPGDELDATVDAIMALHIAARDALNRYRASEAHYRGLFENASDAIFVIDPRDGRFLDVNRRALEVYGYSRDEFLRLTVHDLGRPDERIAADAVLSRIAARGAAVFGRVHRTRAGEEIPVEVNSKRVDTGVIISVVRDVRERERTLSALRESEERYRSVVTSMAEGVVIVTTTGTILACNPSAERILAMAPGQLAGRGWFDETWNVVREDGTPLAPDERPTARILTNGLPQQDVVIGVSRPGNSVVWLSVNCQPIRGGADGCMTGAVISFTDITARKQAEVERAKLQSQLQQAQKMEAIGLMAGGIAHDFNNILASIIGYASLGLDRYLEDRDGKVAGCLKEVLLAGERARDLVAKLMAFSRARPVSARVIDPRAIVKEVAEMMASTIPSSISLNVTFDDTAGTRIDSVHLQQVVVNLCVNARDAITTRGTIKISVRRAWGVNAMCASCLAHLSGDYVEIAVSDDGAGISLDQQSRIFEPFFTTKDPGKGTGMGLSVVHGIVHDYGGHIVVESEPGRGTTVRVWLPAAYGSTEAEAARDSPQLRPVGINTGKHVLVVDDEDVLARLVAEVLRSHGYRVTSFNDSRTALDSFMRSPEKFDAVVTDQTMPGLTGRELAGMVLKVRPDLPIILCTGYSDQIDEKAALEMGIRRFMFKPLKAPDLAQLLDEILATHH